MSEPARLATAADAVALSALLDRFNREFDDPNPGRRRPGERMLGFEREL